MSRTPEIWKATYEATTPEELAEAYKAWAPLYDTDTTDRMGYVGPEYAARMLDELLESRKSRIMDAGCGTGLVGKALSDKGYTRLTAVDYSRDMLCQAEEKGCYRELVQADMNKPFDVPDNTYDAAICVGTFTYAHVGPHAFDELVRVTKPEGFVCFTVRDGAYQEYGYRRKMVELERENAWELQQMVNEDYLIKEDVTAKFCTYKVLA